MIPQPNAPTLGLRNNNPGNLEPGLCLWKGQTGKNEGKLVFDTPEYGVRAIAKLLHTYIIVQRLGTIDAIAAKYAPPNENNTKAYSLDLQRHVGATGSDTVEWNLENLRNLIAGIIEHENGPIGWYWFVTHNGGYSTIENAIVAAGWTFEPTGSPVWWV